MSGMDGTRALEKELLTCVQDANIKRIKAICDLYEEHQVSVNAQDEWGRTALHWAAQLGHLEILEYFVYQHDADVNIVNEVGWGPLHYAARYGQPEVMSHLLDSNADIDCQDKLGHAPLHCAVEHGHEAVIEILIAKGARTDLLTTKGESVKALAQQYHPELLDVLSGERARQRAEAEARARAEQEAAEEEERLKSVAAAKGDKGKKPGKK